MRIECSNNKLKKLVFFFFFFIFFQLKAAKPRVSIITSVYDGDAFIQDFMEDITSQSIFDQCELIMINAASPGNEESVIRNFMHRYPNIIYKKLEADPGIYGVWNMAIGMARADYITNANLDDRLKSDCYEVHARCLDECPEVDLVYSGLYMTPCFPKSFDTEYATKFVFEQSQEEFDVVKMLEGYCFPNNHPMWRKKLHEKYGFFNEAYKASGDYEMWLRIALCGEAKFKKIDGFYGLLYWNPKGLTSGDRPGSLQETPKIQEYYKRVFRYKKMFEVAKKYEQEGNLKKAYCKYKDHSLSNSDEYESYFALYKMGEIAEEIDGLGWPSALEHFMQAYAKRPTRAEPLVRIAIHYAHQKQMHLSYIFAKKAVEIPFPGEEELNIERNIYTFDRYDLLALAAWSVEDSELGKWASSKALEAYPRSKSGSKKWSIRF